MTQRKVAIFFIIAFAVFVASRCGQHVRHASAASAARIALHR